MGWKFEDAQCFLQHCGLQPTDNYQSSKGRVLRSEFLPVGDDLLKRNAVVYYLFGSDKEALLLELMLYKSVKESQKQVEEEFCKLVRVLFFNATGIHLPDSLDLLAPVNVEKQLYTLQIQENQNTEPATLFAFIAESRELQEGLSIRENHLTSSD